MRRLIATLLVAPLFAGWLGCGLLIGLDEGHAGDLCQWIEQPKTNCVARFYADPAVRACGSGHGAFASGASLGTCDVAGGGSVIFDPPIDPAHFSATEKRRITFISAGDAACGSFTYDEPFSFSFTLDHGGQGGSPRTLAVEHDAATGALDVSCPDTATSAGELRHFNLSQVASGGCSKDAPSVPRALFELTPSSVFHPGVLRLDVLFPSAKSDSGGPPAVATYVDCTFPALVCAVDGSQGGNETDVDCGGPELTAGCPPRCVNGKRCVSECDCGDHLGCADPNQTGKLVCTPTEQAMKGACVGLICGNQVKDGAESDVDCGSACPLCADGKTCGSSGDCVSATCTLGTCVAATCSDLQRNGDESDIDCGGTICGRCADGQQCASGVDCTAGGCLGGVCSACANGLEDGTEADVDCGGPTCPKCLDGKLCVAASDCATGVCINGKCAGCTDGKKDGDETDTDCGGLFCAGCLDGYACASAGDCASKGCLDGVCSPCANGTMDSGETDIDCGGPNKCPKCKGGSSCVNGSDCASGACLDSNCAGCTDGILDGDETDVDCGGSHCPSKCGGGKSCITDLDCVSGACVDSLCN
jgi:hypothetical protein